MEYYLAVKKNGRMPSAAAWKGLGIITLSQTEDKCIIMSLICSLKYGTNEPSYERNKLTDVENRPGCQGGGGERKTLDVWG